MRYLLSIYDILLPPIYFLVIYFAAKQHENKKKTLNPEYAFFTIGLVVRMLGAIALGLIYFFYYDGGDTTNYYQTAEVYRQLFFKNWRYFFEAIFADENFNNWGFFDEKTGFPEYRHHDQYAFFIVRLLIPIAFLSFGSYFVAALLTATVTYFGVWKLYTLFVNEFPEPKKQLAFAILYFPSCVFWGSGIMKDSFTLSAVGWYTYGFYHFLIKKEIKFKFALQIIISSFIILSVKPYILLALLPGSLIWFGNDAAIKIKNKFFRLLFAPLLLFISAGLAYFFINQLGKGLNLYSIDSVLDRAAIVQKDMKAEYYGGNTFDIGDFEPTLAGVLKKAPIAVYSGLFRPALWEVRNIVMLIAGFENLLIVGLTIYLIWKYGFIKLLRTITKYPLILFAILFSIFFAFSVGLTVANYGSLVRLRIPELPFFVGGLLILNYLHVKEKIN